MRHPFRHPLYCLAWLSLGIALTASPGFSQPAPARRPQPAPVATRADWFRQAKFGMFIHFGLYSVAGGEWKGRPIGRNKYAEWLRAQALWPERMLTRAEYDELLPQFNPTSFNAEEWVRQAQQAGMTYLIVTAKHHDGFALWPSKVSAYNVMATPFKRDILGELAQACRKHGLKLGFYYSHWQDWANGGANPPWPAQASDPVMPQPTDAAYDRYWYQLCLPQVKELLTSYHPDLLWFDSWHEASTALTDKRVRDLVQLVRTTSPSCLINGRINFQQQESSDQVDFLSMNDNYIPEKTSTKPWEAPCTMNDSWGYNKNDFSWKPTAELLKLLVTCVARGGNYTLNIGPQADGTFPTPAVKRLGEIGAWVRANQSALFNTTPANLPEPAWGRLTSCPTAGRAQLNLFVYQWPTTGQLTWSGVPGEIASVRVLETGQPLPYRQDQSRLTLTLPATPPDDHVSVLRVELKAR